MDLTFFIIALLFFWAGFICAISFMEAWLKFRVKGVTLALGLSIGKKVFTALNMVERVLILLYAILAISVPNRGYGIMYLSLVILVLLAVQTFILLPGLHKRVDLIVEGERVERSSLHVYFVSMELIKVILLLILGAQWYGNM